PKGAGPRRSNPPSDRFARDRWRGRDPSTPLDRAPATPGVFPTVAAPRRGRVSCFPPKPEDVVPVGAPLAATARRDAGHDGKFGVADRVALAGGVRIGSAE